MAQKSAQILNFTFLPACLHSLLHLCVPEENAYKESTRRYDTDYDLINSPMTDYLVETCCLGLRPKQFPHYS